MIDSPFPGMDPYLEDPHRWRDIHHELLSAFRAQLVREVTPEYYVQIEERVYISDPNDPGYPVDIPKFLIERGPLHIVLSEEEVHDYYLVVRDRDRRQAVSVIELLSPSIKIRGSRGSDLYQKQRRALHSAGVHLLEIDLLRNGTRLPMIQGRSDYCVTLYRAGLTALDVWFFSLREPMPRVAVPLIPPVPDTPLDLRQALEDAYRRALYGTSVDYSQLVPPPALNEDDSAWVTECLSEWRTGDHHPDA